MLFRSVSQSRYSQLLSKRRIKRVWYYDGSLMFSYFDTNDRGPILEDTLIESDVSTNDRFFSRVKVEGANVSATYSNTELLLRGERYTTVQIPDISHAEFCYKEARAYARQYIEKLLTASLSGLPDLRLQPEDCPRVIVSLQDVDRDFIIDSITISYRMDNPPEFSMDLNVRSKADGFGSVAEADTEPPVVTAFEMEAP